MTGLKIEQKASTFNKKATAFGNQLYVHMKDSCDCPNILFSPLTAYHAIGLAYVASAGATKEEMRKALQLNESDDVNARSFYRTICKYLKNSNILIANKLFADKSVTINSKLKEIGENFHRAEFENLDFSNKLEAAEIINRWSVSKTKRKLHNSMPPDRIRDNTDIILLSLTCLKSSWANPFPTDKTQEDTFWLDEIQSVKVEMMRTTSHVKLAELDGIQCKAAEIPLKDDLSMFILLPDTICGINQLEKILPNLDLPAYRNCLQCAHATVMMPKFRIQYKTELKNFLSQMGIKSAFKKKQAQFSDFAKSTRNASNFCIDRIVHHALINVNENGIDTDPYKRTSPSNYVPTPNTGLIMKIGHPFVFAIFSKRHRPFFLGRVRNPLLGIKKHESAIATRAVHIALGFAYLTTTGKTADEMVQALQLLKNRSENIEMFARALCKYSKSPHASLGCKFFVNRNLNIQKGAMETFGKLSKTAVHRVDFTNPEKAARTINAWVEKKTNSKIKDLIRPKDVRDVAGLVVSTIHFKIRWKRPLLQTISKDFWKNGIEVRKVQMVSDEQYPCKYAEIRDPPCKTIELPFEDDDHSMLFILPKSRNGIDHLEKHLQDIDILNLRKAMEMEEVEIELPNFEFKSKLVLGQALEELGMHSAQINGDFSNFFEGNERAPLGKIVHETLISVNQYGIEATPFSVMIQPYEVEIRKEFFAHHPFLFAILSKQDHLLFIGTVRNPQS